MVQVIPCFYEEILFIFGRVVKMHIELVPRISCDNDRHNVNKCSNAYICAFIFNYVLHAHMP